MGLYSSTYRNRLGSGDSWSNRAGSMGETYHQGGGSSTQQRVMDVLRSKGQDPWITPEGKISTNPREGTSGYIGYGAGRTGGSVGGSNRLAQIIYEKNLAAEKEMKARDTEQAALNKQAYESGMMSDEEYQALESKGFETTRAQFGHVGREFGERAYGRVNVGALRAGARDIKMREAEAIGGGVRELGLERLRRKSEASRIYAGAEQTRQSQYQIPRYDIPPTMGMGDMATAIGGASEPVAPPPVRSDLMSGLMRRR